MQDDTLAKGEFTVLATLALSPAGLHGTALIRLLHERTGREYSVGALYTTLGRLETKGYVSSTEGPPTPERGGRRKRIYKIEGAGQRALLATAEQVKTAYPVAFGTRPVEV